MSFNVLTVSEHILIEYFVISLLLALGYLSFKYSKVFLQINIPKPTDLKNDYITNSFDKVNVYVLNFFSKW